MAEVNSSNANSLKYSLPPYQSPGSIPAVRRSHHYQAPSRRMRNVLESVEEKDEQDKLDWPDLPPIGQIKTAIARQKVSQGLSYILPVHKTKSSVENVFRTNLRVMFQEPYLNDNPLEYDEFKVTKSIKHHFVPNKSLPQLNANNTEFHVDISQYSLNAESEKVRKLYSQSAPSRGLTGKRSSQPVLLRQRSSLFLPIKAKIPPEAARLKAEAEKILQSVQEEQEKKFDADNPQLNNVASPVVKQKKQIDQRRVSKRSKEDNQNMMTNFRRPSLAAFYKQEERDVIAEAQMNKKTAGFGSYEALKKIQLPESREIPPDMMSPYVSEDKANDIWQWLHHDEPMTEFTQFLQICS